MEIRKQAIAVYDENENLLRVDVLMTADIPPGYATKIAQSYPGKAFKKAEPGDVTLQVHGSNSGQATKFKR